MTECGEFDFRVDDSKSLSEWIACCIRKHVKGDGTMTREQCIAAAHKKFGKSKDFIRKVVEDLQIIININENESTEVQEEIEQPPEEQKEHTGFIVSSECVFDAIKQINDEYPFLELEKQIDLAYSYCMKKQSSEKVEMELFEDFLPSSKCVFDAYDKIVQKFPFLEEKAQLDMSYNWCCKRQEDKKIGKDFVCSEFRDFILNDAVTNYNYIEELELAVDFYDIIVERIDDLLIRNDAIDPVEARQAKRMKQLGYKAGAAKRTPVGQSLIKTFGQEAFQVAEPEQFIKVGSELLPVPTLTSGAQQVRGRISNTNRPMTPVMSSNVMGRAVRGNNLYVQFHGNEDKIYKYSMPSPEDALEAFNSMTESSPGRWVWQNLRGRTLGPVFGKPQNLTPGGTSASIRPYDKMNYNRVRRFVSEIPEYERLSKEWHEYKMEVKDEPTSAEPFEIEEIKKFQSRVQEEADRRRRILQELQGVFKERFGLDFIEGYDKDFVRNDSFDELVEWVKGNITTEDPEGVAIAIAKSRKKKGETEDKEKDWREAWKEVQSQFDRIRSNVVGKGRLSTLAKLQAMKRGDLEEESEKQIYARLLHKSYKGEEEFLYSSSAESFRSMRRSDEIIDEYHKSTGILFDPYEKHTEEELEDFEEFVDFWLEKNDYIGQYQFDVDEMKFIARNGINAIEVDTIEELPSFAYAVGTPKNEKRYAVIFFEGKDYGLNINEDGTIVEPTKVLRAVDWDTEKDLDIKTGKVIEPTKENGKGKGWWGESERHSKAAKKGHSKDLINTEDIEQDIFKQLEDLSGKGKLYVRWVGSKEDITKPSFDAFKTLPSFWHVNEIRRGLYDADLFPDDLDREDREEYAEELIKKAEKGDSNAQKDVLTAFLWTNNEMEAKYSVSERIIDGKREVGLEANGVYVTDSKEDEEGIPKGIKYLTYLKGENQGSNLHNDGDILQVKNIVAIYNNEKKKFIHLNKEYLQKKGSGKGKGWWGESERHSKAAKKGHSNDLIIDFNETFTSLGLKRASSKKKEEKKEEKKIEPSGLTKVGPNLIGLYKDLSLAIQQIKKIKGLSESEIRQLKGRAENIAPHPNQEKFPMRVSQLKQNQKEITAIQKLLEKAENIEFGGGIWIKKEYGSKRDLSYQLSYLWRKSETLLDALKYQAQVEAKPLEQQETSFTGMGLKKKGRGWWGESERHSKAAKKGKKDLWKTNQDGKFYVSNTKVDLRKKREDVNDKRPPKDWWEQCIKTIKKGTPNYTEEQLAGTCGKIYHKMGVREKVGDFVDDLDKIINDTEQLPSETVKHPRSFRKWCGGEVTDECIEKGLKSKDKRIQAKAKLAKAFKTMRKQKKAKQSKDFITTDFVQVNDSTLGGYITRSGPFPYPEGTKYKDGKNLKEAYLKTPYAIAYGSKAQDSHTEGRDRFIGYWDNFQFIPKNTPGMYHTEEAPDISKYDRIWGQLHTHKDISEISDLNNFTKLPVSASYDDLGSGDQQIVGKIHHIATSLNANELDRCSAGDPSAPCNVSLETNDLIKKHGVLRADFSQPPTNNTQKVDTMAKLFGKDKEEKKEEDTYKEDDEEEKEMKKEKKEEDSVKIINAEVKNTPAEGDDYRADEKIKGDPQLNNERFVSKADFDELKDVIMGMKGTMERVSDDLKKSDAQKKSDLVEAITKDPYNFPKEKAEDMTLAQLQNQKEIFDSLPIIQDYQKENPLTHAEVNKHLFDFEAPSSGDSRLAVLQAAQKRTTDFLEGKQK